MQRIAEIINNYIVYNFWKEEHLNPQRVYHGAAHIIDVLDTLEEMDCRTTEILFAAVFHDFVDDVLYSANFASMAARIAGYNWKFSTDVWPLVLSTKRHNPFNLEQAILCDADLSILGRSSDIYSGYVDRVRRENSQYSDEEFRLGRRNVMVQFLHRPRIFNTSYGQQNWEAQARKNIENEIS